MAAPGEPHTLGVIMAADHFRRLASDVSLLIGLDHAELCSRIVHDGRIVVTMSRAGHHSVLALQRLAAGLHARCPDIKLYVPGLIASDVATLKGLPEIDAWIPSLEVAETVLTENRGSDVHQ